MNAYELADELETGELIEFFELHTQYWKKSKVIEATNMLRQQADRIAELEKELNHMRSFFGCDPAYYGMTNAEPVAWMSSINGETVYVGYEPADGYLAIPLYTTPQTKPLSDEEIENLWYDPRFIGDPVAFGKAILRTLENKPLQTDEEICNKCDALTEKALSKKSNRRKAWD